LVSDYGFEFADLAANSTFNALGLVYDMGFPDLAGDRLHRTFAGTLGATLAQYRVYGRF
jgi:hypothetical protein